MTKMRRKSKREISPLDALDFNRLDVLVAFAVSHGAALKKANDKSWAVAHAKKRGWCDERSDRSIAT